MSHGAQPVRSATPSWIAEDRLVGLLLVLAVVATYAVAVLGAGFHFDDGHSLRTNPSVRSLANVPSYYSDPRTWSSEPGNVMYRPTLLVTFAIDFALWGYRASGWVLTNVALHAAAALLVWRLARRIGLSPAASAFAGAVMALHPVHSEVVNYVSSRSESLAAVLLLAALHLHLSGRERTGVRAAAYYAGALVVSFLALTSKETTAGFFAAALLLEALRRDGRTRWGTVAATVGAYAAGLVGWFVLRHWMLGHATAPVPLAATPEGADYRMGGTISILDNVLKVQSRVVVLYGELLAKPVRLNVDHDVLRSPAWSASAVAALLIHAAVVAGAVVAAVRGRRLFPLCVGWFWIFLAPSVALPLNVVMNEHRLYLPGIAVALLAGAALARVAVLFSARWGTARGFAAAAAPLVLFVPLCVHRSREWRSDETLWRVAVERAPGSARAHLHLGASIENRYRNLTLGSPIDLLDEAIARYREAERIHPTAYDVQFNLGNARKLRGDATGDPADYEAALAHYRAAGRIVGEHAYGPRYYQAGALMHLGRHDEALAVVRALRAGDESKTRKYDDLEAKILRRAGDRRGAEALMLRAIALDEVDGRTDGLLTLGWWRFEDGDVAGARDLLQRAIHLAHRNREMQPFLYAARMMHLLGLEDDAGLLESAVKYGWSAPPAEVAWVRGGRTPGAVTGTRGISPDVRER